MESVSFTVPGKIGGKGRPKFARRGKFVHAYTPEKTLNAEAMVRHFGAQAMAGRVPFEGPLALDVTVSLNTPASWSKKKKAAAFHVTGKPDCDNVVKLIGDALNGIVWGDDSQISDLSIRRRYDNTKPESVEIRIYTPGRNQIVQIANEFCQVLGAA